MIKRWVAAGVGGLGLAACSAEPGSQATDMNRAVGEGSVSMQQAATGSEVAVDGASQSVDPSGEDTTSLGGADGTDATDEQQPLEAGGASADTTGPGGDATGAGGATASEAESEDTATEAPLADSATETQIVVVTTEQGEAAGGASNAEQGESPDNVFEVDALEECQAGTPGCGCAPVSFSVSTRESCGMTRNPDAALDGEGFLNVDGEEHLVFAMNRWGNGHIIGWCDSDSVLALMGAFDAWGYLGQTETPRIAAMGSYLACDQAVPGGPPPWNTFWDNEMPEQYLDDPALLAADWDVIVLCGFHMWVDVPEDPNGGWNLAWAPTLRSFVSDHGKGLLAVMDYYGVIKDHDVTNMNDIVQEAGFSFAPSRVSWADASASVALECVPDVPVLK